MGGAPIHLMRNYVIHSTNNFGGTKRKAIERLGHLSIETHSLVSLKTVQLLIQFILPVEAAIMQSHFLELRDIIDLEVASNQ